MRIGILGGTFDPIHLGHLHTAEEVGERLDLEKVYLIPSASPPHKSKRSLTPFRHRLAMVRLAAEQSPLLEASAMEGDRPGFSYSIETLKELHNILSPDPELFFILGMDAFLEIDTWKEHNALFNYAHFVIIHRAGYKLNRFEDFFKHLGMEPVENRAENTLVMPSGKSITLMATTLMDISSTRIRQMVSEGKSIRFLVHESVRRYIVEEGLYGENEND